MRGNGKVADKVKIDLEPKEISQNGSMVPATLPTPSQPFPGWEGLQKPHGAHRTQEKNSCLQHLQLSKQRKQNQKRKAH